MVRNFLNAERFRGRCRSIYDKNAQQQDRTYQVEFDFLYGYDAILALYHYNKSFYRFNLYMYMTAKMVFSRSIYYLLIVIFCLEGTIYLGAAGKIEIMGRSLRSEHPRLLFTQADQQRVTDLANDNTYLKGLFDVLYSEADAIIDQPTTKYLLVGPRLLWQSRACLARVMTLSAAWRFSGKNEYADRAIVEMKAAAAFPDWNPSHFLDVAEMCAALGIGYDWLFDYLSEEDKGIIREAIVEKGFKPALKIYPGGFASKINNWNFVCNGGLILASLALADEEPDLAEEIIGKAFKSIPIALKNYDPEGAWFEGPSYWKYGSTYLVMLLSSLDASFGTDFGFSDYTGLDNTGRFFLSSIGPTGKFFNFADSHLVPRSCPTLFWLARRYNQPFLAWSERRLIENHMANLYEQNLNRISAGSKINPLSKNLGQSVLLFDNRFFPLEIAWFDPRGNAMDGRFELDTVYRGLADVAFFRSSWKADALFAGFKGGRNSVNHAHLDSGSFIFDAMGLRWAEDLGKDYYNLPGYWERKPGGRRWEYFRLSSLSHNVPTINGQIQLVPGDAKIIAFHSSPERAHAVVDLADPYKGQAHSVRRGLAMLDRRAILVQDEVVGLRDGDKFRWAIVTSAEITLRGQQAVLRKEDKSVTVEIIEPKGAVFAIASTRPRLTVENQNIGTRLLTVSVPLTEGNLVTVAILFTPDGRTPAPTPMISPLADWEGY